MPKKGAAIDLYDEWHDVEGELWDIQERNRDRVRPRSEELPDLARMLELRNRLNFLEQEPEVHAQADEWAMRIFATGSDSTAGDWYANVLVAHAPKSLIAELAAYEGPKSGEPWYPDNVQLVRQRVAQALVTRAEEMDAD
ncbi:hypothetical protein BH09GEM1_BH09GEM1_07480 [soil metagenome]